jgi:hypothetical protein
MHRVRPRGWFTDYFSARRSKPVPIRDRLFSKDFAETQVNEGFACGTYDPTFEQYETSLAQTGFENSRFHWARTEANLFAISNGRCHQLANRFEDNFELFVVLAFEFVQTPSEFRIGREHFSKLYKRAHDFDIDQHGTFAV